MTQSPMTRPPLPAAAALLLLASCTAADNPSPTTVLRDSAGVLIAETPPEASGQEWQLQQPPVIEIGQTDGAENAPDLFGSISQAIRLSGGNIAVADGLAREIRIFDPAGSHLVTFGRPGEGPGEFVNLASIAELPADTISAIDNLNGRASLFTSAGAFVRSFPIPRIPGASAPNVVGWLEDGTLLLQTRSRPVSRDTRDQATHFLYAVDRHGEIIDTLGEFPGSRLGRNGLAFGFGARARFAAGGDLAWVGHSSGFELVGHDRTGSVRRIVRLDRTPKAVTQEEIAEARARAEQSLVGMSGPAVERILETEFASAHPVHGMLMSGGTGSLWVERHRNDFAENPGPGEWDIFDAEGTLTGHLTVPNELRITDIGPEFVLGVHSDPLGVPTVRMYRLIRN
ncbi:MAG: hypothetical protein OXE96_13235 [Gemmatimonadetes bacterium]|nr:hypothetical protein [Gemmatimonadota bacterium]